MQLSDNISCIIQHPKQPDFLNFPQPKDPDFLFSVITHFRKRFDHWKEVQAFRFENKIHYTRDAETEYVKHKIELLNNDLSLYLRKYPDVDEAFQAFNKSMKGYVLTYGEGLIRRALQRLK